jgi:hypothetical protein
MNAPKSRCLANSCHGNDAPEHGAQSYRCRIT